MLLECFGNARVCILCQLFIEKAAVVHVRRGLGVVASAILIEYVVYICSKVYSLA